MLKKPILRRENENSSNPVYKVNFDPQLKVIIREARFLDRIGREIPHTIINIALQDKEYARHINKLNQLLRAYNSALDELRPVEKKLLTKQINKLNRLMDKGQENHNWFSLSITEYIKDCAKGIDEFKETKGRVLQHSRNIEKQVQNIENAVLIRNINFKNHEIMDITQFSDYFDTHRNKILDALVKDYQNIGDIYLKSIEECTFKTDTKNSEEMRQYYYYWEKKIFNAITRMVIRALATNKALFTKTGKPMIKMTATFNNPEMSYHPTKEELRTQLDKFNRNILDSTKKFGRWWDGYCKIFDPIPDNDSSEQSIPFTFFDDINHNPVITALNLEIVQQVQTIEDKFTLHQERFNEKTFKRIYDKNEMTKMQKYIEKSASVVTIEKRIMLFKTLKRVNIKSKSSMI
jgi:dynein heavy chain